jgi:plasmid stability protein
MEGQWLRFSLECIIMNNACTGVPMPSLQVRELPDHIYAKLVAEAERDHRSLAQQAVAVLARGLGVELDPKDRRRKVLERIRNHPIKFKPEKLGDTAALIREDRDR